MKALINIDYTYDFIEGNLPCGRPGIDIEKNVTAISRSFIESGDFTVFAVDLHQKDDSYHPESRLFPPHNLVGTKGRNLYGSLQDVYKENQSLSHVYWMDKTRYSAFAGTDLHIKLQERNIKDLFFIGVCTDICVLHTAVDAYNLGYKLHVYENAVASFNDIGHKWALTHFENVLGAKILTW